MSITFSSKDYVPFSLQVFKSLPEKYSMWNAFFASGFCGIIQQIVIFTPLCY